MKIIAFIDRWYNRTFNPFDYVEFYTKSPITYNDIVTDRFNTFRSLGNNWFKVIDNE